jgi:nucleoside-diphosphate-sugar epimerase
MILITGASGFIGKALLKFAVDKYGKNRVIAFTSKPIDICGYILHSDFQFNSTVFEGFSIDYVIHAGAFTPKNSAEANDLVKSNSNVFNTANLLGALPKTIKKIIFLSTLDVYDLKVSLVDENSPINPVSLYGDSKYYCEKMVEKWCKAAQIQYSILRIGHIYGEGEEAYQKLIPQTIQKVLTNQMPQLMGEGNEMRSFLHINDCCRLILKALEITIENNLVVIATDKAYSVKNIIEKIISLAQSPLEIEYCPSQFTPRSLRFDISKMVKFLGAPIVDLDTGLLNEINYFKKLSYE